MKADTYEEQVRLDAIAAMLRAGALILGNAEKFIVAGDPYAANAVRSAKHDADTLRIFAQMACPHPDDEYVAAADCDECCTHCNLCEKTWPSGEGREVAA